MLTEKELKDLHEKYFKAGEQIRELENLRREIDLEINANSKEKVASRFIPLVYGDKIKVKTRTYVGISRNGVINEYDGFFGSWVLDGHQYAEDDGVARVKLRLYDIKRDGTISFKSKEFFAGSVVSIERL